jgi:hypothetical protein
MSEENKHLEDKLAAYGWGTFFVWIGLAYYLKFHIGLGLLGVGINTLFWQGARKKFNLKLEGFWLFVGCLFVIGGLWEFLQKELPLIPIVLIVAGITILISALFKKKE